MSTRTKVKVWDAPVRILHWALVCCVGAAWWTGSAIGPLHDYLGYGVAAIVLTRLAWGFAGSPYARFGQFVLPLAASWAYLRQAARGRAPRHLGHNPLGGWMVVALLSCLGLLVLSGWGLTTDLLWGYSWPVLVHLVLAWLLVALVVLHIAGVFFTSWQHRENLVGAMITGLKDERG